MAREECAEEIRAGESVMSNGLEMMLSTEVELLQAENARLREEFSGISHLAGSYLTKAKEAEKQLAAEIKMRNVWQCAYEESREDLAAARAVIEQMRGAIGAWERADGNEELQEAEAKLIAAMNAPPTKTRCMKRWRWSVSD